MIDSNKLQALMDNYYGTEHYYKLTMPNINYTDGVKAFIENAEAVWFLIDVGLFRKEAIKKNPNEDMFTVNLIVKDGKGDLIFKDGDLKECYKRHYGFTDCPDGDWMFFYFKNENLLIWHGEK